VHVFLIPVLGGFREARSIWCAKDKTKTYSDWMVRQPATGSSDLHFAAIERNSRLAANSIRGTPP
jgi:thiol:disulfide interchange protein DsbC